MLQTKNYRRPASNVEKKALELYHRATKRKKARWGTAHLKSHGPTNTAGAVADYAEQLFKHTSI